MSASASLPRKRFRPPSAVAAGEPRAVGGESTWWPAPSLAGVPVTHDTALSLSAVFACVNVLSTDLSCLPLGVYRRNPDGTRSEAREHPADDLLRTSPDGVCTSVSFRQAWIAHALLWPGGYAEVQRLGNGKPYRLHLLDPSTVRAERTSDAVAYRLGNGRKLPGADCLHISGLGFDGLSGYDLVRLAREVFGLALAAQTQAETYFGNGTQVDVVLKTAKRLSEEARRNLRQDWADMHRGPTRSYTPALLQEGVELERLGTDPEKAQLLETRKYGVLEVCRLFRVPPQKVMDFSQAHLANVEVSNTDYLTTSLMPWLTGIEQVLNLKLFSPAERRAGLYVRHDVLELLRGDMAARSAYYTQGLNNGWLNRDEVRAREDLDPIGEAKGGQAYLVQAQMVPLDKAGAAFDAAAEESGEAEVVPAEGPEPAPAPAPSPVDPSSLADVQATALNGAQVSSLLEIVQQVAASQLPPETAKAMIAAAFPALSESLVDQIVDPAIGYAPPSTPPPPPDGGQ